MQEIAEQTLTVTGRAAGRIREIAASDPSRPVLRIAVDGGGCSGFQYRFDLVGAAEPGDIVIARDGARVAIDTTSMEFLKGSEVDFVDDLIGAAFRINNPNATASCGCGTSFSI